MVAGVGGIAVGDEERRTEDLGGAGDAPTVWAVRREAGLAAQCGEGRQRTDGEASRESYAVGHCAK